MIPKIDKEFASLIPPLTEDEYGQLEKNLLAEGCRDRLVVWGDTLIDGHNRLQICTKHHIPYDIVLQKFEDREAAMRYIIFNQFGRRNLSPGNRSLLALKLEPLYKAKAKDKQQQSPGRGKKGVHNCAHLFASGEKTRDQIAKVAGVSHATIDRVKYIVEHGTPAQVERIKDGSKGNSVYAVYEEIRKPIPPTTATPTAQGGADARPPKACGGDNLPKTGTVAKRQEPPPIHIPPDTGGADGGENDLDRIRGYVADLKNPNRDRSFTPEMFMSEYAAFAERFIRGIEAFRHEPYKEIYPLLSSAQCRKTEALGNGMIEAIQKQNSVLKG